MLKSQPQAFLFDLNGTMIDDMHYHLKVWHSILTVDLQAALTMEEVRRQMYGKNNELLDRVFGKGHFSQDEADRISKMKEDRYQEIYRPHLQLLPGLDQFLQRAFLQGIKLAIGSAAIPYNIDFVLDNLSLRRYFGAVVSADDVIKSKPHPETYLKAAAQLNADPINCIVFEDAPKGVEAADMAGMRSVVVTTMHSPEEFSASSGILFFVADYNDPRLEKLFVK